MTVTLRGTVHGKTIELEKEPGLADGAKVEVIVRPEKGMESWGKGILRSAGALAGDHDEEDEQILNDIYEQRKRKSLRDHVS